MATYEVEASDAALPLELVVDVLGVGGVAGLAPTLSIRDAKTAGQYLDFADNTFKSSGWTAKSVVMGEVGGGRYTFLFDLAATGRTLGDKLAVEYTVVDATAGGSDSDLLLVIDSVAQQQDVELLRKYATNRLDVSGGNPGTMILYDDNGTTPLRTHPLRDASGGAVTNVTGSPARRGAGT